MTNEIKGFNPMEPRRSGGVTDGGGAGKPAVQSEGAGRQGTGEKVTLTETAQKFANLSAEVAKGSEIDEARVEQLRSAIDSGQYQPDPVAIADALIRFEKAG